MTAAPDPRSMCENCSTNPSEPRHPCPSIEAMQHEDGPKSLCNCCEDCTAECADDI